MIYRKAYMAFVKEGAETDCDVYFAEKTKSLNDEKTVVFSAFRHERLIVIYLETEFENFWAENHFKDTDFLLPLPLNDEHFVDMELVFHYNAPKDAVHWRRTQSSVPTGALRKIRSGMLSSYLYYHYLLQETTNKPRSKYFSIFLLGSYLFFYDEKPETLETPVHGGKINGIIPSNWRELMNAHFDIWKDGDISKNMKLL